jgi:hypothetical protein
MIYDVGNPSPCLGQAQKWCGIKPVNGIPLKEILNGDGQQFYQSQQTKQPHKNSIEKKLVVLLTVIL